MTVRTVYVTVCDRCRSEHRTRTPGEILGNWCVVNLHRPGLVASTLHYCGECRPTIVSFLETEAEKR